MRYSTRMWIIALSFSSGTALFQNCSASNNAESAFSGLQLDRTKGWIDTPPSLSLPSSSPTPLQGSVSFNDPPHETGQSSATTATPPAMMKVSFLQAAGFGSQNALSTYVGDCTSSNPRIQACATAAHRLCSAHGFAAGSGPVEFDGNTAWVLCQPASNVKVLQTTFSALHTLHTGCSGPGDSVSDACSSAVNRFCINSRKIGGAGIAEIGATSVYVTCVSNGASRESASWHELQTLHSECRAVGRVNLGCASAVNRYCSALGYTSGYGINEYQELHAEFLCFQNSVRDRENVVDTLSFFVPARAEEHRTGADPAHPISLFSDLTNNRMFYTKFGDPSVWMMYSWDNDYISLPIDTTVPEYDASHGVFTGRILTSLVSQGYWLKRKMRVGESLYVQSQQTVVDPLSCRVLYRQSFPYVTRIKSFVPHADFGGDLGVKSLLTVEYTYFVDNNPVHPTYNSEEEIYVAEADPAILADGSIHAAKAVGFANWTLFDDGRKIKLNNAGVAMNARFNSYDVLTSAKPKYAGTCPSQLGYLN